MIAIEEFVARRARLREQLQANSIAVIPSNQEIRRSRDTDYPFRQDSDFYYLTGFNEPDAVLLLTDHESVLFCRSKDPEMEIWHGRRLGPDAAVTQLSIDEAYNIEELADALPSFFDGMDCVYYSLGHQAWADTFVLDAIRVLKDAPKQTKQAPLTITDPRPYIHEMRLIKSAAEIETMARAAAISADAHKRAMQAVRPGMYEYQLEAELHYGFSRAGARQPAYGTIVGGGVNACILHYTENSDVLNDGELVLIDAGGELDGYAADITRTFPINGRFSREQAALYQLVLDAQHAALGVIKPGATLSQATDACVRTLVAGLLELGLLQGNLDEAIEQKTYRRFFMHGLGHWLGLDVHDVGRYRLDDQERPFEPGMVLTVEPGIYVAEDADVDPKWRGIGIRIEDNIVITEQGYDNLTADVPKQIEDIEAWQAQRPNLI